MLADKAVINWKKAKSLAMREREWGFLEIIVEILRPLSVATNALSNAILCIHRKKNELEIFSFWEL